MSAGRTRLYAADCAARGLPGPDAHAGRLLVDILDGGVLGASRHVVLAQALLRHLAADAEPEQGWRRVAHAAGFIAATRGAEAPIVANALTWLLRGLSGLPAGERAARLEARAAAWEEEAGRRRARLVEAAAARLEPARRLLAFDYSSTVAAILVALERHRPGLEVVVPESRAIDGGRPYLHELSAAGLRPVIALDVAIEHALAGCDAVLLGAESLRVDGSFLNTLGSRMTARLARWQGVEVFACADLFKLDRRSDAAEPPVRSFIDRLLPAGDPLRTRCGELAVAELDIVPAALVTAILTEIGPVQPAELRAAGIAELGEPEPAP